jgi:FKBP-type peptidyl-prolyl cis-trans isomerase FkpA
MKLKFFILLLLPVICFVSCRKITNDPDIKAYDQQQIQSYIAANGITGMVSDNAGGDTTGTWHKIINPGATDSLVDFPSTISYVYTIRTFDGKYIVADTVLNHFYGVLGHVVPTGLMLAIRNDLKYRGGQMRVLVPSHMAYGKNGVGTGSITLTNGRIAGNQCLDITVNLIKNQDDYDQLVIKNYMAANNLSGYTEIASGSSAGLWYKITTPGTGNVINDNSVITQNYTLYLMNNTNPDQNIYASTNTFTISDLASGGYAQGYVEALRLLGKAGGAISIIVPSKLAYGTSAFNGVPANGCLRWDISNVTVTNQ